MKNIGQYNQDLSVPRKKDIDSLETRVKTNEDNIAMAESDIEGLNTDIGTLKTDVNNVKTALSSKQDTIVGAASTIVEDNLAAGKVLVSDASGKVSAASVGVDDINPDGKYLKLTGGTLTGELVIQNYGLDLKLGTEGNGAIYWSADRSLHYDLTKAVVLQRQFTGDEENVTTKTKGTIAIDNQGIWFSDGNSQSRSIVGFDVTTPSNHKLYSSTNLTLIAQGLMQKFDTVNNVIQISQTNNSVSSDINLRGVADATNTNDAVNLKQLNEVKSSIPSSSDFVKTSGGVVTGPLYLFGGTGPLAVKNGAVTLNEGYSIGYGDGNYNFTQINGNFLISKGGSSQGVYIGSSTDGTNGTLSMYVNNDSQNASTHMSIASNGVIKLEATEYANNSLMVNNVRVTGVADGTDTHDAVNLGQLRKTLSLNGGASIPENADLNSYINVGNYGMSYNIGAATLKNCPTTNAFTLYVLDSHGSATNGLTGAFCYIIQIIIDIKQDIYTRAANTGATASDVAFMAWKRIADIDELNSKIQYSTTDLTAGSSSLATGTLYVVYE